MPTIKTAISIREPLYRAVNRLARKTKKTRSQIFAEAAQQYVEKHRNWTLFDQINKAYGDDLDNEEQKVLEGMINLQSETLVDKW